MRRAAEEARVVAPDRRVVRRRGDILRQARRVRRVHRQVGQDRPAGAAAAGAGARINQEF